MKFIVCDHCGKAMPNKVDNNDIIEFYASATTMYSDEVLYDGSYQFCANCAKELTKYIDGFVYDFVPTDLQKVVDSKEEQEDVE